MHTILGFLGGNRRRNNEPAAAGPRPATNERDWLTRDEIRDGWARSQAQWEARESARTAKNRPQSKESSSSVDPWWKGTDPRDKPYKVVQARRWSSGRNGGGIYYRESDSR